MKRVRRQDTGPELTVRRVLHGLGYRFRLHRRDLPGTPDIVFPRRQKAIFVHGCFWHRHHQCSAASTPKTRTDYWFAKFEDNVARDLRKTSELESAGWNVYVVWGCETKDTTSLAKQLEAFLEDPAPTTVSAS